MNYIDLGLPSGNLWCDCNYGTNYPTESGKYFTFEEVEGFMGNKEELIPTKDDFQELLDYCKWERVIKGYKITGPNGNSIFLPAAGWCGAGGVFKRRRGWLLLEFYTQQ